MRALVISLIIFVIILLIGIFGWTQGWFKGIFKSAAKAGSGSGSVSGTGSGTNTPTQCLKTDTFPVTAVGKTGQGSCPAPQTGTVTAMCQADGTFGPTDTSGCVTPNTISAGGYCVNNGVNVWDEWQSTTGRAKCNTTNNMWTVECPAGTVKTSLFTMSNTGRGGEGAVCSPKVQDATACLGGKPGIWDEQALPPSGKAACDKTANVYVGGCPAGTEKHTLFKMTYGGYGGEAALCDAGTAAGGVCLYGVPNRWDGITETYGNASCDKTTNIYSVTCPPGTTKIPIYNMTNSNRGGEGAICV
ncbi:uncharacterized protein EV422DRAFT_507881 [Fimicolochytrium jonesii]|uniref:uncharacterized protein n=1 Tax=Fimicolochytrium jonesii TaxID=1396493 RepID=UPI0022FED20F|nr:uncharacterized protein EV422DRAFT_507881 [Fimicolochytrium jonesii]KAI8818699.1 hypothetical protein EV422DRAFT_507881 [Fimicolochytrium jonesii]